MEGFILILYLILGYWAVGKTIYANYLQVGKISYLFLKRLILGTMLGIVLIPIAIIKSLLRHKDAYCEAHRPVLRSKTAAFQRRTAINI